MMEGKITGNIEDWYLGRVSWVEGILAEESLTFIDLDTKQSFRFSNGEYQFTIHYTEE